MHSFLHVAFNFQARATDASGMRTAFDQAVDWVRYAPNCWILKTTSDPDIWYARLKPLLREDDSVFICEVNLASRAGFLPNHVWDWIARNTGELERATESDGAIGLAVPRVSGQ